VWESKQPAWIEDVRHDPNFPRTDTARKIGLKTAVGIPILSGDKFIAVIEFFMRESRNKSEQLVKVIAAIAAQLNLLIERKRAEEELCRTYEILQSILSNMGDAVIVADKDGKFLFFNPVAERFFGKPEIQTTPNEWSQRFGLYLPDKVTLFPHEQLPSTRSIRGEEVNNVEIFVRQEKAAKGLWVRVNGRPLKGPKGELLAASSFAAISLKSRRKNFFVPGKATYLR
jgi:PAS domain-containing protein